LLAKYDTVLAYLPENEKGQVKYLSPKIQDEVINIIPDKN
jgi:hypothetical protein